jgi:hypothetical protein
VQADGSERQISRYDFEGGQYVRVLATSEIDTEEALDMVQTMIELKRAELVRKKKRATETVIDWAELVAMMDADQPAKKRGPYKKAQTEISN